MKNNVKAVLFDMDGTLIDSAPDLLAAINHVRERLDLPPRDLSEQRHIVSRGAAHMLSVGLEDIDGYDEEAARRAFLDYYTENYWVNTRPYDGVEQVLAWLAQHDFPWGVVTNKSRRFAEKVMDKAGWNGQSGVLVCGDTLSVAKPDPAPVRHACEALGVEPARAVMIGDDERDILAGRRAGALTALAEWGYLLPKVDPESFGADRILRTPAEVPGVLEASPSRR